jgi:hypothetical protein
MGNPSREEGFPIDKGLKSEGRVDQGSAKTKENVSDAAE